MISTAKATNELNTIKDYVKGLFKMNGRIYLVMDYQSTNDTVDTLYITEFGAIQKDFNMSCSYGVLRLFPENKNLNQMLNDPYKWSDFINSF